MRLGMLASLAGAALALTILPAEAAWHGYFNNEVGFSFTAPGEVKVDKATFTSASAGQRDAVVFRTAEDNIEYTVTIVDFAGRGSEETALIKEAATALQSKGKVLADADARVDSNYGRKLTIDVANNGGRSMAAIYFKQDHLIQLQVTVLPANGDYGSPDLGRFVDSVAFLASRIDEGATELRLAK